MKNTGRALFLSLMLALCGCTGSAGLPQPTPSLSPGPALSLFESYVAQTSFRFPQSWEYQQDEVVSEGLTALYTFEGGQAGVQFLWMDESQQERNVFLSQLELEDVSEQDMRAGAYEGKLVSGAENGVYTLAFEGARPWYDASLRLYMRVVVETVGEEVFIREREHLLLMLDSVSISTDADLPVLDPSQTQTYDYSEDFGLIIDAPERWWMRPDYDAENRYLALDFEVATGDNVFRVETGTVSAQAYDAMVQSLKDLGTHEDVYEFVYAQSGQEHTATCLHEGKINRVRLLWQRVGDDVRYLWCSSALRPALDAAYYQSAVVPSMQSIQWEE